MAMSDMPVRGDGLTRPPDSVPSYADKLKTNIKWDNRLQRNVLEIILENDNKEFVEINDDVIEKLFRTLGIDVKSHIEGCFRRSNTIFAWLVKGIDLDRFCRAESIKICNGVRTKFIRPAGKKEVTVKVSGLDFNTPDTYVREYLGKFGKVVSETVIYEKYKEGPFAGKCNGDRKYSVDFTQHGVNMGTFHIIDGARVKVFFNGNKKTCARCHQTADVCKGEALAADCEENGGYRIPLSEHMKKLWESVNFRPSNFQLAVEQHDLDANLGGDVTINKKTTFSPNIKRPEPTKEDIQKYTGISINNFPKDQAKTDIIKFLKQQGLPDDLDEEAISLIDTKNGTKVEISPLENTIVTGLMKLIHFSDTRTKFFDRPLYCRALRDMTPEKKKAMEEDLTLKNSDVELELSTPGKSREVEETITSCKAGSQDGGGSSGEDTALVQGDFDESVWDFSIASDAEYKEPSSKLFKRVGEEETSEDNSEQLNDERKKFRQKKSDLKKRGRDSSGKKLKEDKKPKK